MNARRLATTVVGAAALAATGLVACGPAGGTVRVRNVFITPAVVFDAAPGQDNDVTFTSEGADVLVHDAGDTLTGSDGCSNVDANTARCTGLSSAAQVVMILRDGDDIARNDSTRQSRVGFLTGSENDVDGINGGSGNDELRGGPVGDTLVGGEGDDELDGGDGDDLLVEGITPASSDVLDVDTFTGGPDEDAVSYGTSTLPVSITLRDDADDGTSGEGDHVQEDIEGGSGGRGADTLIGDAGDNRLFGGGGNDSLVGQAGADQLSGQGDDDTLFEAVSSGPGAVDVLDADTYLGGPGVDRVSWAGGQSGVVVDLDGVADDGRPTEGDDVQADVERISGTAGSDTLVGDQDDNVLDGGGSGDFLVGNEGQDDMVGGPGNDTMTEGASAAAADGLDADDYRGGSGVDTANYTGATLDLSVDLDGLPDDGRPGEEDNVLADVEHINGGNGHDTLTGDGDPNTIFGNGGGDDIGGAGGADILRGGSGVDALDGGPQTDDCNVGFEGGTEVNCEI